MPRYSIVGGGPVGTLMALLLAARGQSVRLIERRRDPRTSPGERGRSINLALAERGLSALRRAGLMPRIGPHMVEMPGRMLHDEHGRLEFLRYGQLPDESIFAISRADLALELIAAAAAQPLIDLAFAHRCLDVDPHSSQLRWRDAHGGATHFEDFEILLGADGAGSAVRNALQSRGLVNAREQPLTHDYKELTIPAAMAATGAQYAFEPHALHIWPRGGFMLIALPNPDYTFTATLFLAREGNPGFTALTSAAAVRAFFEQHFADAARAIPDLEQQFLNNPQGRLATLYCDQWQVGGRILLLGDAAHAIVPFHGQGLNCGFEDCAELVRLLDSEPNVAAAFAEFERQRRPNSDAIAAMALENFIEMRDGVRSAQFAQRKALAAELELAFPNRFIPRYSMVMFHPEIPYSEAQRRGQVQERILEQLGSRYGWGPLTDESRQAVAALLE